MSQLLIAQVTDTHVVDPTSDEELFVDNNARLAETVRCIAAESPAITAVLATGDLTNWGHPAEYEQLRTLLEPLPVPVLPIPGNHDDRDRMRATFPDVPWADASHASWTTTITAVSTTGDERDDLPAIDVVGLDSSVPGAPGAAFDDDREAWLADALARCAESDRPTVLALHHPPFRTGIAWMDRSGFEGLDRFAAVLAAHHVDRIVCGHLHRPMFSSIAGIPVQAGLPTVQAVDLDLDPDAGVSLILDPVGYQIMRITDGGIVTHTRYIATDAEPFVPDWADDF